MPALVALSERTRELKSGPFGPRRAVGSLLQPARSTVRRACCLLDRAAWLLAAFHMAERLSFGTQGDRRARISLRQAWRGGGAPSSRPTCRSVARPQISLTPTGPPGSPPGDTAGGSEAPLGQPSLRAAVDFVAAPSSPRCVFELCSRHDPRRRLSCPHACRHACRHAHAASALTPRSARRPPTRFLPPYLPPLVMPAGASTEAARAVRGRGRRRAADDAGDDQARSGGAGARRGSGGPRVGPHAPPAAPPHLRCTPWLLGVTRPPGSPRACVKVIFLSFEWSESVVTFDPSYFWDMCTGFG